MLCLYRLNRKILFILILSIIVSLNTLGCKNYKLDEKDGIIARVNEEAITEKEFNDEFEMLKKMHVKQVGKEALSKEVDEGELYEEKLKDKLLESMILERIIGEEMEKFDIEVTDEEIEEEIKTRYVEGFGGEEEYKEFLKENNFTKDFLKSSIRKSMMNQKYREYFFTKVELSEDELEEYYDSNKDSLIQVKVSMIKLKTKEDGDRMLEKLGKGENFNQLATIESIDPVSASKGGDMGYLSKGTFKYFHEIEDKIFSLEEGEISDLIEHESGYYIISVEDRKEKYEDLKEYVISVFKNEKYIEKLSQLKSNADIKIYKHEDKED